MVPYIALFKEFRNFGSCSGYMGVFRIQGLGMFPQEWRIKRKRTLDHDMRTGVIWGFTRKSAIPSMLVLDSRFLPR